MHHSIFFFHIFIFSILHARVCIHNCVYVCTNAGIVYVLFMLLCVRACVRKQRICLFFSLYGEKERGGGVERGREERGRVTEPRGKGEVR